MPTWAGRGPDHFVQYAQCTFLGTLPNVLWYPVATVQRLWSPCGPHPPALWPWCLLVIRTVSQSPSLPACQPTPPLQRRPGLVWSGLRLAHLAVGRPRKSQGYPSTPGPEHPWTSLITAPASSLPGSSQAQQQQQATAKRSTAECTAKPSPARQSPSPTELNVVSPISLHNTTCTRSLIFRDHNPLLSAQPAACTPRCQIQSFRPDCTHTTSRTRL